MALWKLAKDKVALSRLEDEAFHAAAVEEINSGRRRDGLWAKAIIESGGNDVKAKITYLRLLVVALRDEHYLAGRLAEESAAQARAEVQIAEAAAAEREKQAAAKSRAAEAAWANRKIRTATEKISVVSAKANNLRVLQCVDEGSYQKLLELTGELRFHYLLQRWYKRNGSEFILNANVPSPVVTELQKYFSRYCDH